jgi:Putative  PD-(D/E)XK family member, (DUF4420)
MADFSAYESFKKLSTEKFNGTKLVRSLGKYSNEWVYFGVKDNLPGLYLFEPEIVEIGNLQNVNLSISNEQVNILGVPAGNYLKLSPVRDDFDLGLFSSICDEFIRISDSVVHGFDALKELLARWSALLKFASNTESTNALVGLYGELLTIDALIREKGPKFIEHWTGPDSARHDFEGATWAIEVKSSTVLAERRAVIHGASQLASSPKTHLALLHYQLEWAPGADSIASLAAKILHSLPSAEQESFLKKIEKIGFSFEKISELTHFCLKINSASLYHVDEDFPRITKTTLGNSASWITRVDYWLLLEGLPSIDVSNSFAPVLKVVEL